MLASQDQTELFHLLSQLELFKQSQGRQSLINTRREFDIDFTSLEYLRSRIFISLFPSNYLTSLQGLHHLLVEIDQNNMLERWTGLEAVSNQTMLNRIGNATINRGFDFLAVCTALVGTIGLVYFQEVLTDK